jgi:hypothetical protein
LLDADQISVLLLSPHQHYTDWIDWEKIMIKLQIALPEDLARDVEELGLLQPEVLSTILRNEVRQLAFSHLLGIAEKLAAAGDIPMTPNEVQEEIRSVRRG